MINIRVAAVLLSAVLSVSCTHSPRTTNVAAEYIIIGPGGGFRPPIGTYYYLSSTQLLADTAVVLYNPPSDITLFKFDSVLPSAKHAAVKDVLTVIPWEILANNHGEFGISTAAVDGGYTVVRTSINGIDYDWKFHDKLDNASVEVKQFMEKVKVIFIK